MFFYFLTLLAELEREETREEEERERAERDNDEREVLLKDRDGEDPLDEDIRLGEDVLNLIEDEDRLGVR